MTSKINSSPSLRNEQIEDKSIKNENTEGESEERRTSEVVESKQSGADKFIKGEVSLVHSILSRIHAIAY